MENKCLWDSSIPGILSNWCILLTFAIIIITLPLAAPGNVVKLLGNIDF